ncbi:SLC5 family protein [Polymorphobacter arshaanensis]|uniref:SLC5 family protein n=1 Tax=Glacieibacterium arshaanense TaxID=2511025 RepID=A0A4Y9EQR8_9SPHN|nr:SLC5 family protein [Polymorphobacter arshaanensis]TFU05967.1 SLC5 family protein [Polymorphobacter arshaanensis]
MTANGLQWLVFGGLTLLMALATTFTVRRMGGRSTDSNREYFLAGGNLTWPYIAGSITLTNLSTDQLVGMNGNQMLLLAWWELSAIVGLLMLAFIFLPIYYRNHCTTTTELLERKYGSIQLRALVSVLFLLGNVFIYLPIMLYTGSLFLKSMFGVDLPVLWIAAAMAVMGTAYAVGGGLRAVAVYDTISGVGVLGMALLVTFLALAAINFDFSGIPPERLSMIGGPDSPIPWPTLLTGMIFIQMFYWSTNQTITQRAMAAPSIREGQKGVLAAVAIRILIVPAVVVLPGVAGYKLFGDIGDATYGRVVATVMPGWLSGAFAAFMLAAVLTSYTSVLNSSVTLYVCDLHEKFLTAKPDVGRLNRLISLAFMVVSIALVPVYSGADSIINLVQQLNGLLSMPILSVFIVGLLFTDVDARAMMAALLFGVGLYAVFTFLWTPVHYIHLMLVTLLACIALALALNRLVFGRHARWVGRLRLADGTV